MAGSGPCQRRQAVKEFIILTDFSRCQGRMIGRVSRRLYSSPIFKTRIFHDHLVPGNENRPALRPRLRCRDGLSRAWFCSPACRFAPRTTRCSPRSTASEIRQSDVALAEEELGPSLAQMDPATKKDNVLSFLIDMKIVAKAAEDKKVDEQRGLQEAPGVHPQPAADGQPAGHRGQGRDHRRGHEEGL